MDSYTTTTPDGAIVALYRRRMGDFGRREERLDHRANWISLARLATFLAAATCFSGVWLAASGGMAWLSAGMVFAAAFVVLVGVHGRVIAAAAGFGQLKRINAESAARVLRNWRQIPLRATATLSGDETLAGDLDLFGEASLFHLVASANTPVGVDAIADWFLHPADREVLIQRQEAVAELSPALDARQDLQRCGLKVAPQKTNLTHFLWWADADPWLARRRPLVWTARCLPAATLLCILLAMVGAAPASLWLLPLVANIVLSSVYRRRMHEVFGFVSSRQGEIGDYAGLFRRIAETPVTSVRLTWLQQQVAGHGAGASRNSAAGADCRPGQPPLLRHVSLYRAIAHLSWDFHVLALLERWQRRNGRHVRRWFEALGEWEALASLAGLGARQPGLGVSG